VSADAAGRAVNRATGPRRLVLLRHGRTAWNATGRAQGHADVELDQTGHAQAAAVAPWVASLGPVALWSSDLARARQTAAYVEKETGLVATLDARLREYDVGERSGLTTGQFADRFPDEHAAWLEDRRAEVPGAEETADVLARSLPAYEEVLGALGPGELAVVVTHGAALKVSVAALLGWPVGQADSLRGLANCAAAVVEQQRAGRRLVGWNLRPDFDSDENAG